MFRLCCSLLPDARVQSFMREEGALAVQAPAIAGQIAVLANDAVARDNDRYWIGGAGASDGANGAGFADGSRHFAIGFRRAVGDSPQFFPDAPLKRGCLYVGRQIEVRLMPFQVCKYCFDPCFEAAPIPPDFRPRIFFSE